MNLWQIVKFQINVHCHMSNLIISESDIECLALLAMNKESELTEFCNAACEIDERDKDHVLNHEREIFKTPQSVRNSVNKLDRMGLINKKGKSKKRVSVDKSMKLHAEGNIFVEFKFLRKDDTQKA